MGHEPPRQVTQLLQGWREGDSKALDELLPLVYKELRRLAHFQLQKERADHTLQSSALVHEAYLRLAGASPPRWENRAHFFAIAGQLMCQILVDYARRHRCRETGGSVCKLSPLDDAMVVSREKPWMLRGCLDDALKDADENRHATKQGRRIVLLWRSHSGGDFRGVGPWLGNGAVRLDLRARLVLSRNVWKEPGMSAERPGNARSKFWRKLYASLQSSAGLSGFSLWAGSWTARRGGIADCFS